MTCPASSRPPRTRLSKATIDGAYGAIMTRVARRMWARSPTPGELQGLMDVLAPDVVLMTDGVGTMLVEDGVVTQLFLVRNPDKLGSVACEVALSRL
jgi:hypothetical protein